MPGADPLLGRVIAGKFEIQALLGVGAMGRVYKAHNSALDKLVAVKVLQRPENNPDPMLPARFKAEARAASRLDHPNSVQILDFGEDGPDKLLYIAMELLQGQNLGAVLKRVNRLSTLRACNIMTQVLAALAAAHRSGVVHRDLKPANIMLVKKRDDDGEVNDFVKVCDFGIAKVMDTASPDEATAMTMTKAGAIFGTPAYMSPEQARGEKVDLRTDIYSCGVIMYRMITGQTPFKAESAVGLLTKLMTDEAAPLSQFVSTIDPRLEAVVMRAMAKDRMQRFGAAVEMRAALKEILGEEATNVPSARGAEEGSIPPELTRSDPDLARAPGAPFQTLTGTSWTRAGAGTWTGTGIVRPAEESARWTAASTKKLLVALAIALALTGLGLVLHDRWDSRMSIARLAENVGIGAYGAAENMYHDRWAQFSTNAGTRGFIPEILRQRRAAEQHESRIGIPFDPSYVLTSSEWLGVYYMNENRTQRFICVFEYVDAHTFEGYLDWPDAGVRAAIHGIRDGNHLVFWDYEILAGTGDSAKNYTLQDKKNVFLSGDRFEGTDGPFMARIEGKLVR